MAKKKTPKTALLQPVFIPNLEPVFEGDAEGAHGGIGLRNVESPLVVYLINPKDGVGPGSVATLHWTNRNVPVASTPIRAEDVDQALIPLTVAQHNVAEFWANPVYAKLRRATGNESFTQEIKVRVRLNRPGGDPGPGPGHQGLMYDIPPEVLLNGVSEAIALAGVKITIRYWRYMRAYDLIRLVWGSRTVEYRVQPGEEGRDVVVNVDYETIKGAGNNPLTRVAYQVRDAGGNLPAEGARWSSSTWLDVHLNEVRPEAPWLAFPDTHPNSIDLSELGSWNVEVQTWVTSAETGAFSHVALIWDGKDSEGNPVPHTTVKPLVGPGVYTFTVDNALVAAIADGTANVHALYQRAGGEQPSQKLYLEITGQVIRWPAPRIREDLGGHLDPAFVATVYFRLQESWPANGLIEVVFRVSSPDNSIEFRMGREVDDVSPTPAGDLEFTVPATEVKRFEGHLVDVFYVHTRPGSKPQESLRLQIVVGVLVRTMPVPIIDKAIGGQLNPDDIGNYAQVYSTYTETLRSDWIRMFWIGPRARTEVPVQVAINGATTEHDIDKTYLTNNLNETVAVFYSLTRGSEMPRYSQIAEVLISRDVGDLPAPTLLGADVTGTDTADLEPLKVEAGTQLEVIYTGMRNEDRIKVIMAGAGNGGSPDIPEKFGNQTLGRVEFDITSEAIAANIRDKESTVKFHYVVTRAGALKASVTLTVTVKPIPLAELAKTVIKLNQANATTQVLDLTTFTGNAMAHIGVWPFIFNTRPVWLRFLGKTASNVQHNHLLFNGAGASQVNPTWIRTGQIEWPLSRAYLAELGHGTQLSIEFKAAFSASKVEAEAVSFPLVTYTVNTIQVPVEFPVPILVQATGTGSAVTLPPLNAQNGGTVQAAFTPMYTSDSITMSMVGTAGAGSPPIAAKPGVTSGVVTFDIPKEAIAANIGNANKTFTLKYDVTRSGITRSSAVLTVTVTPIPLAELAKTVIKLNQANATTQVLDLTTFTGNATAHIGVWPFIFNTRSVWLRFLGKTANGVQHDHLLFNGAGASQVNPTWIKDGHIEWPLSRAYLAELGHGTQLSIEFKAAFSASKVEAEAVSFPLVTYTVNTVQVPVEFPAPILVQAPGPGSVVTLPPLDALDGGTALASFTPMYTTDSITMSMVGTAGAGSPPIAAKPGVTSGVVTFAIPKAAIAANIGNANKTFTLKYDVTRSGMTRPSAVLTVTVTPIPQASLPTALINNVANNGTLNVVDLNSATRWRTEAYPFQIAGAQLIWLTYTGTNTSNQVVTHAPWDSAVNNHPGAYEYLPDIAWLKTLKNGSSLTIEVRIAFDKVANKALAVVFPLTHYTVSNITMPTQYPVPTLTQAIVTGAATATLAPLNAQNGGTISVAFTPMDSTYSIKVTMVGAGVAGSPVIAAKPGVISGVVTFDIPKTAIAANIGNGNKTFTLKYDVTKGGKTVPSAVLTVTVTPIPQAELLKTVIQILQANQATKVLDLSAVTGGATSRVGVWPFITVGYPVWLKLTGLNNSGTAIPPIQVWNGAAGAAVNQGWINANFLNAAIAYNSLKDLGHNRQLTVAFKASMSTSRVEADAVVFPLVSYTIFNRPFDMDESLMTLNGANLIAHNFPIQMVERSGSGPIGSFELRAPRSGTPPYTCVSANPNIASATAVDNGCFVRSTGNGSTTITVTDSLGRTGRFTVNTSNVQKILYSPSNMTLAQAIQWKNSLGGRVLDDFYLDVLQRKYLSFVAFGFARICTPKGSNGLVTYLNVRSGWEFVEYSNSDVSPEPAVCITNL